MAGKFVTLYKQAEARATKCVAPRGENGKGLAFLPADRVALVSAMWEVGDTSATAGAMLFREIGGSSPTVHMKRLELFEKQVSQGKLRVGNHPTGAHLGKILTPASDMTFDGRIKSIADVQPAFNRAARQLIKVGITTPEAALKYVSAAFETAKVEQKIDMKAERIVRELQIGDMTREQVLETLQRVKQSF